MDIKYFKKPRPEKITLFVPTLCGGGAERVMVYLANGFACRGFAVDLVLVEAKGPYLSLVSEQVRVIDLNCGRALMSLIGLVRYLKTERPHAIISTLDHANVMAIIAHTLTNGSQKILVRSPISLNALTLHQKDIWTSMIRFLVKYFYHRAHHVIAVSKGAAQDLVSLGIAENKVKTIYNPAITPDLVDKAQEPLKHSWFTIEGLPVILGVGRLAPQKDFTTLIHAFANLNQQHSARLIILGEGEDRPKLESLVKSLGLDAQVSLPGFVDNPFSYMKHSSVFVLSSLYEGMPNALLQAMACGIPVVATDCPNGPREILEDGKWGRLVPVGDAEAMSKAILASLEGKTEIAPMEILESRFGLENIIDHYLSLII
jgi:glycosyltransferase involved in cell wall biosynthesis